MLYEVKIIRDDSGGMSLVEWMDDNEVPQRNKVKTVSILDREGNSGKVENPEQGIPYGVDFEHTLHPSVTSRDISRELRKRGLWTTQDLQRNPQQIVGALQAAYGVDFAQIIQIARQYDQLTED